MASAGEPSLPVKRLTVGRLIGLSPVFSRNLVVLRKVRTSAVARAGDSSSARRSSCALSRPASR